MLVRRVDITQVDKRFGVFRVVLGFEKGFEMPEGCFQVIFCFFELVLAGQRKPQVALDKGRSFALLRFAGQVKRLMVIFQGVIPIPEVVVNIAQVLITKGLLFFFSSMPSFNAATTSAKYWSGEFDFRKATVSRYTGL